MNILKRNNQASKNQAKPALSFHARETFISQYTLFALLEKKDIRELTLIAQEVRLDTGAIITKEGDIVDSVYLIVSGAAKVTRAIVSAENTETMDLSILKKGEAIGLTGTGFFSRRGVRTATVTAMEPMILLAFNVADFQRFLQKRGIATSNLKNVGDKILLMNFIQQSKLFKDFSVDRIQWLAKNVNKISVPSSTILFKEGDAANEFYFIVTGCISLASDNVNGRIVRLYESNSVIGVDTFAAGTRQNSLAKAEINSELFVINRGQIEEAKAWQPSFFRDLYSRFMDQIRNLF